MSSEELQILVNEGVVKNVKEDCINAASIDITLGARLLIESRDKEEPVVHLANRMPLHTHEVDCANGYMLRPGEFILAHSEQEFNLPNDISAEYKLKSSMARIGINHALAGWCDAGWHGSVLTLELMNVTRHHHIVIKKGDRIGQMIFFRHQEVLPSQSYAARGRYNGDLTVKGMKS